MREAIELYGAAYPHPRPGARSCSSSSASATAATYSAADLSGGQRRRLDLALGLAGDPELIFLDEPTTGFDPAARRQSWELIASLRALGKTILLTTHYMEEAQHLADRVVVLAKGRIVAEGTPDELGREDATSIVSFRVPAYHEALPLPDGASVERGIVQLPHRHADARPRAAARAGPRTRGMELEHLTVSRPDARGRLSRPHREEGPHDRSHRRSPLLASWIAARMKMTAAQPARARLHVRVPADPRSCSSARSTATRRSTPTAQHIRFAQFYTPAIAIFSLVTACYTTLVLGLATARDQGLLKRVRGTPLPMGIYLGSWVTGRGC